MFAQRLNKSSELENEIKIIKKNVLLTNSSRNIYGTIN
jgi:hypothetical protein